MSADDVDYFEMNEVKRTRREPDESSSGGASTTTTHVGERTKRGEREREREREMGWMDARDWKEDFVRLFLFTRTTRHGFRRKECTHRDPVDLSTQVLDSS